MGNPTDELRTKLDELGVEHFDHENGEPLRDLSEAGTDPATSWRMDGASVCAVPNKQGTFDLWIDNCTPEQAIAATVGNRTDLSKRLREVTGLHSFAELFGFDWTDDSDWTWHDVACAMSDVIDAATVRRSCASCPEMDNPDSYIAHLHRALEVADKGDGTCEWCKDGKTFDKQTVMVTNHGWQEIRHCPNCGRRLVRL